jgi:hypothetical protein
MTTDRSIIISSLLLAWALLLSSRTIAAAIYATRPSATYEMALKWIGWVLPTAAWFCFAVAIGLLICALIRGKKDGSGS